MTDLDNTANCRLGNSCEGCGDIDSLTVATIGSPVGVFCMTLCGRCTPNPASWRLPMVRAVHRTLEHCEHLDIDADQMAAAMEAERR